MQRGKIGQAKHDKKVAEELKKLIEEGYSVKADLPKRAKPPKFGGRVPDIVAKRNGVLLVEEIETRSSLKPDRKQQEQIRKAVKKQGGTFKIKIAK